jgi:hypothetical protein
VEYYTANDSVDPECPPGWGTAIITNDNNLRFFAAVRIQSMQGKFFIKSARQAGRTRQDQAGQGRTMQDQQDQAGPGRTRQDMAGYGRTRQDIAGQGRTRQD